ncbi:histidine kinase [Modestobacter sp. VKM Ac-2979]|uniref:sensor histidine kinase n=1 Tax=unclassified Modestobacter TaxID=2643866 RepID=UPI0022AB6D60|nr:MULTISPECIES: histidine kinase [unclassified Modestobacter]MCZ2814141.1 histidine kinase [Modestobacter sp. VKM Ac-2979]MCZ2844443.1 histidine kinase [Modestobacter sp. VKM Ac-2980]
MPLEVFAGRLLRWARAHPLLVDASVAALVHVVLTAAVTTTAEVTHPGGRWLGALTNLVLVAPLVWRRLAPLATLVAVLATAVVTVGLIGPMGGEAAALVALGTAVTGASSWPRTALPVAVAVLGLAGLAGVSDTAVTADRLVAGVAALVAAVAVGAAGRLARERRLVLAEQEAERESGRNRAAAERTAQALAAERARIARELHDVVAHEVTVMVSLADGAQVVARHSPERAHQAMAQVSATGREALRELRGLLGVLAPDDGSGPGPAPQPGIGGIGDLVERVRVAGLDVSLQVEGTADGLDPMSQLTVYRVVQEALTNVLRHATSPTRAEVRLDVGATAVQLEVLDDGVAAGAGRGGPGAPGRGLLGMHQRAALHGADLEAGPVDGGGWRVALRLPLTARAEAVA